MLEIVTLKCAGCGANLDVKMETTIFACGYCGVSQSVERHGGTVSLRLLTNAISKVQTGTDKTAAELAIRRLKEETEDLKKSYQRLEKEQNNAQSSKAFWYGASCFGGCLMALALMAQGGFIGFLGLFLFFAVLIGCFALYSQNTKKLSAEFESEQQKLVAQEKEIQRKMAINKRIVDK